MAFVVVLVLLFFPRADEMTFPSVYTQMRKLELRIQVISVHQFAYTKTGPLFVFLVILYSLCLFNYFIFILPFTNRSFFNVVIFIFQRGNWKTGFKALALKKKKFTSSFGLCSSPTSPGENSGTLGFIICWKTDPTPKGQEPESRGRPGSSPHFKSQLTEVRKYSSQMSVLHGLLL